jgi:DNA-3-methyladenine glycosylase I
METSEEKIRCPWCGNDELYVRYHDEEWGVPLKDDQKLFELLILECAQAGISWLTVLKRRENYRAAFKGFDPHEIARWGEPHIERLMGDEGIIRNRKKLESTLQNARAFIAMQKKFGSFSAWLWNHVNNEPIVNSPKTMSDIPVTTPLAQTLAKELKALGFTFVGPTIMYSYLQSAGLVDDHLVDCWRKRA